MPSVFRLAYVDLATPAIDEAVDYYTGLIGTSAVERSGGSAFLSLGLDHHNISLHTAARAGLTGVGLQVGPETPLEDLAAHLDAMGLQPQFRSDARPGVTRMLVVEVGGHAFHLIADMAVPAPGFARRGIAPSRLGHLAVMTPDAPKVLEFLGRGLGFTTTDWFEEQVTFVTCNRDHHVLNVIEAPIATLHHMALELRGGDHHFAAADTLARHGKPILWGPSRHTAGHNIASYHYGADGALVELYSGMDVFVPELGYCEPRPWHEDLPQRPKHWSFAAMTAYETPYEFDFRTVAFGVPA